MDLTIALRFAAAYHLANFTISSGPTKQ